MSFITDSNVVSFRKSLMRALKDGVPTVEMTIKLSRSEAVMALDEYDAANVGVNGVPAAPAAPAAPVATESTSKRRGRPKGSTNAPKVEKAEKSSGNGGPGKVGRTPYNVQAFMEKEGKSEEEAWKLHNDNEECSKLEEWKAERKAKKAEKVDKKAEAKVEKPAEDNLFTDKDAPNDDELSEKEIADLEKNS